MDAYQSPTPRQGWAYFLDVDGTLLEIAERPDDVRVDPPLIATLDALRGGCEGALALISGRRIHDLDRLFWPLRLPAAGVHGLERRRADGSIERAPATGLSAIRRRFAAFAAQDPRLHLEDKGLSIALHYRLAPHLEDAVSALSASILAEADRSVRLLRGKMVVEFCLSASDKGQAIAAFMAEAPFIGRRPVFAGDDLTDEDGFRAVLAMRGMALRVGADAPTVAPWRLPSVAALRAWLQAVAAAASPEAAARAFFPPGTNSPASPMPCLAPP